MDRIENFARSSLAAATMFAASGCIKVNIANQNLPDTGTQPADMQTLPDMVAPPDLIEAHLKDCSPPKKIVAYRLQDELSRRVLAVTAEAELSSVGQQPMVASLEADPQGGGATNFASQTMDCTGAGTPHVIMEVPLSFSVTDVTRARFGIKPGQECKTMMYHFASKTFQDGDGTQLKPYKLDYLPSNKSRANGCFKY